MVKKVDKDLFKDVTKVKLSDVLPGYTFPPGFDHAIVDKDKKILNFCSSRYNLVKNKTILTPIEEYFKEKKIDFVRKITIINDSKFYVDYIIKQKKKIGNVIDVFPKISIWNSYDGGCTMRPEFGFYITPSNYVAKPDDGSDKKRFKHSSSIDSGTYSTQDKIIDIIKEAKRFIDNYSYDLKTFEKISNIKSTKKKINTLGQILKLSKKVIEAAENQYEFQTSSGRVFINEEGDSVKHIICNKNLFTVYTSLNYGIYNTNLKELPEKKIEKDKELLNYIISHEIK